MKNLFNNVAAVLALSLFLAGCGGGGGSTPNNTKGSAKLFLYGTMSSARKVATLHAEIKVPDGVMLNYSSPPGGQGKYALRSGVIIPSGSGSEIFSANDLVTADYRVSDRTLFIDFVNLPLSTTQPRKDIRSGTIGNGVEFATINFRLATANSAPALPAPGLETILIVGNEKDGTFLGATYANGLTLNFVTSFYP